MAQLSELFKTTKPLIGMVHLLPLPGSPRSRGDISIVEDRAVADVRALVEGGVHGVLFENFGDAPFTKGKVKPLTVSTMTRVVLRCVKDLDLPFGINVLRNDWEAALGIAATTGASFIRVNILSGVYATDSGMIEGEGYACMRERQALTRELGIDIALYADALTKHGRPLTEQTVEDATLDLVKRVGVDGVIITGPRTGAPAKEADVAAAKQAAGNTPVLVGSGVNPDNIKNYSQFAQGFIVGSYLKKDGKLDEPVDSARLKKLVQILED